jgi:TPR repeat protein
MRISESIKPFAFALALSASGAAFAFDVREGSPAPEQKGPLFRSVGDALREGLRGLTSGNPGSAVEPLSYAAREGNVAAQWKLGRMYAEGEGVRRDELKAYEQFSRIVNRHAETSPDSPNARMVSQAFVALGSYHLTGIPNTRVKRDTTRAAEMFHYAASFFNDADAQYNLGRIFAEGLTGSKDFQQAARWFHLGAEKGHIGAQARLGQLMYNGDGVPRQVPRGLMWMRLAAKRADPVKDQWIVELHERAQQAASEDEQKLSEAFVQRFERGR